MKSASAPSTVRQTDVVDRLAGSLARWPSQLAFLHDPIERGGVGVGALLQPLRPADRLRPFERPDRVLDREHRRRVDRLALEDSLGQFALGHETEDLRQRPVGRKALQPLDRTWPEDKDAVRAFAAEHLLPGEGRDIDLFPRQMIGEHSARCVGEGQAFAVVRDPVAIGHANPRSRSVPGEQDVVRPVDLVEVREERHIRPAPQSDRGQVALPHR